MLAVEKWAKGKNPAIAFLAIRLALVARVQCEALRDIKDRRVLGHTFQLPDLPSWFAMYQSQKPILAYNRLISNTSDFADEQRDLFSDMRKLNKRITQNPGLQIPVPSPQELEEGKLYWLNICSNLFAEIKEDISPSSTDNQLNYKFLEALKHDELPLSFYYLV
jgi:hypothetical protein